LPRFGNLVELYASRVALTKLSLVGGTVIDPADGKVLPNATVVIDGDKIERVALGKQDAASLGKQIECVGKFILPGYIDTHIHFFQSGDLFTRRTAPISTASALTRMKSRG
jgi:imidazolonepropionase-like amidohydrolase